MHCPQRICCWKVHSPSKIDLPFASCQTEAPKSCELTKNIQVHWLYSILLNSVCFTSKNFMTSSAWFPPTSSRTHLAKPQEATALKMAHTEARLQRSEQLRQQLHGSFANVLGRLENSERKESQLHQVRAMGDWEELGSGRFHVKHGKLVEIYSFIYSFLELFHCWVGEDGLEEIGHEDWLPVLV